MKLWNSTIIFSETSSGFGTGPMKEGIDIVLNQPQKLKRTTIQTRQFEVPQPFPIQVNLDSPGKAHFHREWLLIVGFGPQNGIVVLQKRPPGRHGIGSHTMVLRIHRSFYLLD